MKARYTLRHGLAAVAVICLLFAGWKGYWQLKASHARKGRDHALRQWQQLRAQAAAGDPETTPLETAARKAYFQHQDALMAAQQYAVFKLKASHAGDRAQR